MEQLKQIQAVIFTLGLHQNKDAVNKLMVFCTDANHGNLVYAERIFNDTEDRSLVIYNLLIKAFVKANRQRKAIHFFSKLRENGLSPDNFTYPFVLKAIGCLHEVSVGENVHGYVIKTGLDYDTYVCNSLMDMYAEFGYVGISKNLFDEIPDRDVVSWNIMISGLVRCKRFGDAVAVFRRMEQERNLKPDEATYVSTLSACIGLKDLELGKYIHNFVNKELKFSIRVGNALLDMYSKCGNLELARKLFDQMPEKNVICWTSMVSGYANSGMLDEARELFDRSPIKDVILWTAMINGYVQFNRFDEAVSIFRQMQLKRIKPDRFTLVSLLTGCAQMGALEQGKWIHKIIEENNIGIDAIVGTALIEMYSKCGFVEKSVEIFNGLKDKDTASWTSIICGLAMNGEPEKALCLFSEMEMTGAKPDDITFIGLLTACSHGGLVDKGRNYFHSMKTIYQIEPKLEHYGCLIDLFGRAGRLSEAKELIEMIPNKTYEIRLQLYGSLLSACRIYGNVEMGEQVAKQLIAIGSSDSSIHTLLANMYASVEKWEDFTKVRGTMKALNVKKFPGCSSIEVNGIVHEFLVGDSNHSDITEIYFMLDRIFNPLLGSHVNEMDREMSCL